MLISNLLYCKDYIVFFNLKQIYLFYMPSFKILGMLQDRYGGCQNQLNTFTLFFMKKKFLVLTGTWLLMIECWSTIVSCLLGWMDTTDFSFYDMHRDKKTYAHSCSDFHKHSDERVWSVAHMGHLWKIQTKCRYIFLIR